MFINFNMHHSSHWYWFLILKCGEIWRRRQIPGEPLADRLEAPLALAGPVQPATHVSARSCQGETWVDIKCKMQWRCQGVAPSHGDSHLFSVEIDTWQSVLATTLYYLGLLQNLMKTAKLLREEKSNVLGPGKRSKPTKRGWGWGRTQWPPTTRNPHSRNKSHKYPTVLKSESLDVLFFGLIWMEQLLWLGKPKIWFSFYPSYPSYHTLLYSYHTLYLVPYTLFTSIIWKYFLPVVLAALSATFCRHSIREESEEALQGEINSASQWKMISNWRSWWRAVLNFWCLWWVGIYL